MKFLPPRFPALAAAVVTLACQGAIDPAEWPQQLRFMVTRAGLTRLELAREALAAARPDRGDVRLLDPAGKEVPWRLHRGIAVTPDNAALSVRRPEIRVGDRLTILTFSTGTDRRLGALRLVSSATDFFKPVTLEGERDGAWERLVSGVPLYHRYQGATELMLDFPSGNWRRLRLTLDDRQSPPIPVQGVDLVPVAEESFEASPVSVTIRSRTEEPGVSRLHLDLGSAGLDVANLEFDTPDSLFTRPVRVVLERVEGEALVEQELARAWLHRIPGDETMARESRRIRLNRTVPTREIVVVIHNGDSPPLTISAVRAGLYTQQFEFWAAEPGEYRFLAGHRFAVTPRYDIALTELPRTVPPSLLQVATPLVPNPAYREPALGPEGLGVGAAFQPQGWHRHRSVRASAGLSELELSLEVMARARTDLADLRLVRDGRQIPYVIDRVPLVRLLKPVITGEPRRAGSSTTTWRVELPEPGLPLRVLRLTVGQLAFVRPVRWIEIVSQPGGERWTNLLASGTWHRALGEPARALELRPGGRPANAVSWIEIDNGDNPPLDPDSIMVEWETRRLVFLTSRAGPLELYFDNPEASPPRYDLALLADRIPGAARTTAAMNGTAASRSWWRETLGEFGISQIFFWLVLVAVVAGLFQIIRRLLPAPPPSS